VPATEQLAVVAEDTTKVREYLVTELGSLGVAAIGAKTGLEALKVVSESRPGLILLDGLLPEMHGFEVARAIRKLDPHYRPLVVIITAVYKSIQYQNEARLKYGIDDYLIKPVTRDALRKLVERMRATSSV
jgi:CheY-like chemotaxis protein